MSSTFNGNLQNNVILNLIKTLGNEERNVYIAHKRVKNDMAEINSLENKIKRIKLVLRILQENDDK